ncbi:MAG: hypothetical protein ACRCT7_01935 [Shewanella sp.]
MGYKGLLSVARKPQTLLGLIKVALLFTTAAMAAEPKTVLKADYPLRQEGARDANGQLIVPTNNQPHLILPAPKISPQPTSPRQPQYQQSHSQQSRYKQPQTRTSTTSSAAVSPTFANDPSCRWLNNRIQLLNEQQQAFGHQPAELRQRRQEWRCLDCSGDGPTLKQRQVCSFSH